jgi:5-(carboxyamino)imidazole ribonucleotide synthase
VATLEFENIPLDAVRRIARFVPVRPGARVLRIAQDRLFEKNFLAGIGVPVAPYAAVSSRRAFEAALARIGRPSVLKTRRLGYDGKGQWLIAAKSDLAEIWVEAAGRPCILEGFVDFACEISVVVARSIEGEVAPFVPVENRHRNHILDTTIAPARIAAAVSRRASAYAAAAAERIGLVGLLALEMFVLRSGRILANEIAPRPHNSGHWTIEACLTSQFEQHIRAVCGFPLGSPERHSNALMRNLIGEEAAQWPRYLADPSARLHLYGKAQARPGRKMGHVTWLKPRRG